MRERVCLLLFFATLASAAFAQTRNPAPSLHLRPGMEILANGWRTQAGDSLAWAQPGLDDSAWQPANLAANTPLPSGRSWYRLRLHLDAGEAPTALLLFAPAGSFEVWIDGKPMPGFSIASWLHMSSMHEFVIPLPSHQQEINIALRFSFPPYLADSYRGTLSAEIGGIAAAEARANASRDGRVLAYLPSALLNIILAVAGIGILVLFFAQRSRPEYLWLGLYFVILGTSTALWNAIDAGLLPYWVNSLFGDPIFYLALVCQIEFSFAFINRKVSRAWRACEFVLISGMLVAWLASAGMVQASAYWLVEAVVSFAVGFGLPALLLVQYRRGNREAGLLILPSLLPAVSVALNDIGTAASSLGFTRLVSFSNYAFHIGRVQVQAVDLSDMSFLLAIGALLVFRFTRISHQQARAAAELEAAQRVQSLLLRRTHSEASHAQIDVVYRPAQEVGGDFFHLSQIDGATRVVVGDVSGKGMGAAMLVSVLLGALDGISDANPVAVLRHLNSIMLVRQQGGFATCLCAVLSPNGELSLANAGHLAPYRNGEEVQLESGLPLGIAASADYSQASTELAPGDSLTFLSDGVVEAKSVSGELFGFDRTAAISARSARQIAAEAQAFGQEDDITVLTLTYVTAEVLHS